MAENNQSPSAFLELTSEPTTRTSRIEELLESTPARPTSRVTLPPRTLDELRNSSLPVNGDLMQRLQSFLPAMEQSTQELQQRARTDPTSLDIEHLGPSIQEYIEMNLGLGVYESRANRQSSPHSSDSSDIETETDSSTSSSSSSSSDSDSDSEDSDASGRPDVLSILMSAAPPVPRMPNPPAHPNIVMLPSNERTSSPSA